MKELSRKTFITIFGILTAFLVIGLVMFNVQNYRREKENIQRNLSIFEDRGFLPGPQPIDLPNGQGFGQPDDFDAEFNAEEDQNGNEPSGIDDVMIMDYEVYSVEITDGDITRIISHGNQSGDFDVASGAVEIMDDCSTDTIYTGVLYFSDYSYNYKVNDSIVIINNAETKSKLLKLLLETLLIFVALEVVIYVVAKLITKWITKPAKEAFDKQKEFIADASHELKTPLAVIMASSDELAADENNSKYVENIKYESDRMSKLIAGLLDLSKLEEGISKDTYKEENLSKIVEKTSLVFEGVAFEQGVEIETDVEEGIVLKCSKDEIEKLVSTIIDNAIKHSDKNTSVVVKLYRSGGKTVLKVTNTGNPIEPGDEEKIFERFYRADKSRNRSENRYGLGLAIAKRIVTNHGGTIKASSEDRKTTFKITF